MYGHIKNLPTKYKAQLRGLLTLLSILLVDLWANQGYSPWWTDTPLLGGLGHPLVLSFSGPSS